MPGAGPEAPPEGLMGSGPGQLAVDLPPLHAIVSGGGELIQYLVVLAIVLKGLGPWVMSPWPWVASHHFRLLGVTYRVTTIRVGSVGPPFN